MSGCVLELWRVLTASELVRPDWRVGLRAALDRGDASGCHTTRSFTGNLTMSDVPDESS